MKEIMEIRNPKSEIRKKSEDQSPNGAVRVLSETVPCPAGFGFRALGFFRISAFDIRAFA
jgi:hypothetical protein